MEIHLPNSAFLGNIDAFLKSINPTNNNILEVTFNKKWMSVHPVVLSMVGALGIFANKNGFQIKCENLEATSKHYLERMGLIEILNSKCTSFYSHESSGRFIPLSKITNSDELSKFITDMIPLLHISPKQAEPIKYVMSELVRNVFEHANSPVGAIVCAQYFKKTNRVSIGVTDLGVGIRKAIEISHLTFGDLSAIQLALSPGITGWTGKPGGTETNAGAGLFIIKSIAVMNRDFFMIYSGNAMFKLLKRKSGKIIKLHSHPSKDRHSSNENLPYWQGTVVGIDISLDNSTNFNKLFEFVRDVYRLDIKERKKNKFKKARFL